MNTNKPDPHGDLAGYWSNIVALLYLVFGCYKFATNAEALFSWPLIAMFLLSVVGVSFVSFFFILGFLERAGE